MDIVHMYVYKMYAKYRCMVPTLSGPLGLPWCGSHRLTNCPGYLVLLLCLVKSCCVQTNCPCHLQCMGIVPMHEWKVPLKYWGMFPFPSGPLGLRQAADTFNGKGLNSCKVSASNDNKKLSNLWVVTRWSLQMPVDPAHTIGGTPHWGVLGEGPMSLAGRVCTQSLCEGTFTDDSGRCVMVFKQGGVLFEWLARQNPRFSNIVARTVHANIPLRAKAGSSPYNHRKIFPPPLISA